MAMPGSSLFSTVACLWPPSLLTQRKLGKFGVSEAAVFLKADGNLYLVVWCWGLNTGLYISKFNERIVGCGTGLFHLWIFYSENCDHRAQLGVCRPIPLLNDYLDCIISVSFKKTHKKSATRLSVQNPGSNNNRTTLGLEPSEKMRGPGSDLRQLLLASTTTQINPRQEHSSIILCPNLKPWPMESVLREHRISGGHVCGFMEGLMDRWIDPHHWGFRLSRRPEAEMKTLTTL